MTPSALIRQADLKRMASIAKELGVSIEVEIEGKTIRVSPNPPPSKQPKVEKPAVLEF